MAAVPVAAAIAAAVTSSSPETAAPAAAVSEEEEEEEEEIPAFSQKDQVRLIFIVFLSFFSVCSHNEKYMLRYKITTSSKRFFFPCINSFFFVCTHVDSGRAGSGPGQHGAG